MQLLIHNLSAAVSPDELLALLSEFGKVSSLEMTQVADPHASGVQQAMVEMDDADADQVLRYLDGDTVHGLSLEIRALGFSIEPHGQQTPAAESEPKSSER